MKNTDLPLKKIHPELNKCNVKTPYYPVSALLSVKWSLTGSWIQKKISLTFSFKSGLVPCVSEYSRRISRKTIDYTCPIKSFIKEGFSRKTSASFRLLKIYNFNFRSMAYKNVALILTNTVFHWWRGKPETSGNIAWNMALFFMIIPSDHFHASLKVAPSDFWVTISFNFERLEQHHYQSNKIKHKWCAKKRWKFQTGYISPRSELP